MPKCEFCGIRANDTLTVKERVNGKEAMIYVCVYHSDIARWFLKRDAVSLKIGLIGAQE